MFHRSFDLTFTGLLDGNKIAGLLSAGHNTKAVWGPMGSLGQRLSINRTLDMTLPELRGESSKCLGSVVYTEFQGFVLRDVEI